MSRRDYDRRLNPLRKLLSEAEKKCRPPLPKNTGIEVCTVRSRSSPRLSVALMIKARPDKIPDFKECIRLHLLFYAALHRYIKPEGAGEIKDHDELDKVANKLEEIQKDMVCEHNIVKLWRFIRDKRGIKKLDGFFG